MEYNSEWTRAEVYEQSVTEDRLLVVISHRVFDLTLWADHHPGGSLILQHVKGKDATAQFWGMHSPAIAKKYFDIFCIGSLSASEKPSSISEDFENIRQELINQGLFKPRWSFYMGKFIVCMIMFAFVWLGVLFTDSLMIHCLCALLLGLFWQQIAFLGHDAGHIGISHNITTDRVIGLVVGNFFTGISLAWWKKSHNIHHTITNAIEHDPDIQHLPLFAISSDLLKRPIWSTYYKRFIPLNPFAYFCCKYQCASYYIIMAFARVNLYFQSFMLLLSLGPYEAKNMKGEFIWSKELELRVLFGFWLWFAFLVTRLPDMLTRVLFVVLSHNIAGILHVQITLSHFVMPTYLSTKEDKNYGDDDFVHKQLETTLDISCPWYMNWFHGGLQYQVEHHLFPRLPRHSLEASQKIIKDYCNRHNLNHCSAPFIDANYMLMGILRKVSSETVEFKHLIYDAMNLNG